MVVPRHIQTVASDSGLTLRWFLTETRHTRWGKRWRIVRRRSNCGHKKQGKPVPKTSLNKLLTSMREFLRLAGTAACVTAVPSGIALGLSPTVLPSNLAPAPQQSGAVSPDYVLRIGSSPIEIAPKHIVSTVTYNGQFPGPLLRFKEGRHKCGYGQIPACPAFGVAAELPARPGGRLGPVRPGCAGMGFAISM